MGSIVDVVPVVVEVVAEYSASAGAVVVVVAVVAAGRIDDGVDAAVTSACKPGLTVCSSMMVS